MVWKNSKIKTDKVLKAKTNKKIFFIKKLVNGFNPINDKKLMDADKVIVRSRKDDNKKEEENLFKITDPILLRAGIKHSIDRLTGNKVKNSFIERQVLKLEKGLMRLNKKKNWTRGKKVIKVEKTVTIKGKKFTFKDIKGNSSNIEKRKKYFRKLQRQNKPKTPTKVTRVIKTPRKNRLYYFRSRGLVTFNRLAKEKLENKKRKPKKGNYYPIKVAMLKGVKDGSRIHANLGYKALLASLFKTNKNYIPNSKMSMYRQIYRGSLITNSQEIYLQSKLKKTEKRLQGGHDDTGVELVVNSQFLKQKSEHFNNFLKQCFYKNLLFRSFWFGKFISTLVKCGKKQMVWKSILKSFGSLKVEFGKNPVLILFEILELYRMPMKALPPKDKTRKVIVRTHLISWWKQYTQLLRWIRHSLLGAVKNHSSWNSRIVLEITNLLNMNHNTLIKKKCDANYELVAFGKVNLHFRWYRRFSKRAVNAIKIIDKPLYNRQ